MLSYKEKLLEMLVTLSHRVKEFFYTIRWYSWKSAPFNKTAVFVCDGRLDSCGMTDRFIGAISLYCWAKQRGVGFRIHYTYPFKLTDYLIPNDYDWIPKDGDYVESVLASKVMYAIGEPNVVKRLDKRILNKHTRQIHFYGNRDLLPSLDISPSLWGKYFLELFRPTVQLQSKINSYHEKFGRYFSVCFRFQNLLGDFSEYNFKSITDNEEKEQLIKRCINQLKALINKHPNESCLITADSVLFLERAKEKTGCYSIEGSLVHMGSNSAGKFEEYQKSFIDFYMLAGGTRIYNVVLDNMYSSGFPLYAAKLYNIPFERIYE